MNQFVLSNFNEKFIPEISGTRFRNNISIDLYEDYLDNLLAPDITVCIFVGSDSGLLLNYLKLKDDDRILFICVETDDFINSFGDDFSLPDNIKLIKSCELDSFLLSKTFKVSVFSDSFKFVKSFAVLDGYDISYILLYQKVFEAISFYQHKFLSSVAGKKVFFEKNILNSPDLVFNFSDIKAVLLNKNVLVIGGGPSLAINIDWLKESANKFVTLAVTRAGKFLESNGFYPDFYVTVDPNVESFEVSLDLLENKKNIPLIASNHTVPKLLASWNGPVYYLGDVLPWKSKLNKSNFMSCGPTVTQAAICTAMQAEAKQIFLIGVDLCYSNLNLQTHSGYTTSIHNFNLDQIYYNITTYAGEVAKTDVFFKSAIDSTEMLLDLFPNTPVFNLSINAARIEGVGYKNPLAIADDYDIEQSDVKFTLVENKSTNSLRYKHLINLRKELASKKNLLENVVCVLEKNILSIKDFDLKKDDFSEFRKGLGELDSVIKELLGENFMRFCSTFGMSKLLKVYQDNRVVCPQEISFNQLVDYHKSYNESWLTVFTDLIGLLVQAIEKIEVRVCEINGKDSFFVSNYWLKNEEFNRYKLPFIADSNGCKNIGVELSKILINHKLKVSEKNVKKKDLTLLKKNLLSYILALINIGDLEGLKMICGLSMDDLFCEPNDEIAMTLLIECAMSEIINDSKAVYSGYEKVLNIESVDTDFILFALNRILTLALKNNDIVYVYQALDCLSLLSSKYYKFFGDFLMEVSDFQGAIDKYTMYFENHPEDAAIHLKIADAYDKAGYKEQSLKILENYEQYYGKNS